MTQVGMVVSNVQIEIISRMAHQIIAQRQTRPIHMHTSSVLLNKETPRIRKLEKKKVDLRKG